MEKQRISFEFILRHQGEISSIFENLCFLFVVLDNIYKYNTLTHKHIDTHKQSISIAAIHSLFTSFETCKHLCKMLFLISNSALHNFYLSNMDILSIYIFNNQLKSGSNSEANCCYICSLALMTRVLILIQSIIMRFHIVYRIS